MYQPQYSITDKLLNAIVKIEIDKSTLTLADIAATTRANLKDEAKTFNLFHLAHMLGMNVTVKDAQKLAEGRKLELEGPRAKVLNNFRNVLEFNRSNVADSYVDLDLTLLLHLNKLILNNWKEPWDVKVRTIGEPINLDMEVFTAQPGSEAYVDLQSELIDLSNWFKMSAASIHPLIRLGVLLGRLIQLRPVLVGNSLTILAVADFFLARMGYSSEIYVPPLRTFDLYSDELNETLQNIWGTGDLTLWLERLIWNLAKDIHEQRLEVDKKLGAEKERNAKQPFLDLNKRQLKVLKYLQTIPVVKREDYCQMMDVSTMTAYRDLDDLVKKKLIKVDGRGRGTKYMLISR